MPKLTRSSGRTRATQSGGDIAVSARRQTRSGQPPSSAPPKTSSYVRKPKKPPALAFLARSQEISNADSNRQLPLFALPRELVRQIADHLSLVSVICLTLTCKEAVETIGTESWANYKKEKRWAIDREGFIELLARDWGDILDYCPRCDTLHPVLQPPRSHRETGLTKRCFGQDAMIDYLPQDESHGYNPVFVHIFNALEESKDFASKGAFGPRIDTLSGNFTMTKNNLYWNLDSSGQRIDGNIIIKHVHSFRSQRRDSLCAEDLLALPIRLCPHQSTTTATPEPSFYIKGRRTERGVAQQNGRLLTLVITSAFSGSTQSAVDWKSLKPLTPLEQAQVVAAQAGENVYWRCRSCPTKYRAQYSEGRFTIASWHCFGRDLYHASRYWKMLVRRTGTTLGTTKRNDEWWSSAGSVPDFMCEIE